MSGLNTRTILKLGSLLILLSSLFIVPRLFKLDHTTQDLFFNLGLVVSAVFFTGLFFISKISRLKKNALLDPVTGLYNYKEFNNRIEQEKARTKRTDLSFALLLIDIDDFKTFNSQFGYKQADKILLHLVEILKLDLRKSDTLFRYRNGDEFAILASNTDTNGGQIMSKRIQDRIQNADFKIHSKPIELKVSIGVSAYHGSFSTVEEDAMSDLSNKKQMK